MPAILLGLSGPSCSGKTTLARILRDALSPHAFILHEDDFYVTDALIPVKTVSDGRRLQDWDCLEAIDQARLRDMLAYVKERGRVREGFESKEDLNAVGNVRVDGEIVEAWKGKFGSLFKSGVQEGVRICIVDGFLLFSEEMKEVRDLFDLRLLLRVNYEIMKRRREARSGYTTLEGFWEDPPGYVDEIVWPGYVRDHRFLFADGNVEGEPDEPTIARLGIDVAPKEAGYDMTKALEWAAEILMKALGGLENTDEVSYV
jgi:nicotinamide/nicotinate riboside kinase